MRARSYEPIRKTADDGSPRGPAALDAARPAGSRRAPQEYRRTGLPAEPRASVASLRTAPHPRGLPRARTRAGLSSESLPHYAERAEQAADPSRYDDALYGQIESGEQEYQRDPAYPDDPYAYQSDYEDEPEPQQARPAAW